MSGKVGPFRPSPFVRFPRREFPFPSRLDRFFRHAAVLPDGADVTEPSVSIPVFGPRMGYGGRQRSLRESAGVRSRVLPTSESPSSGIDLFPHGFGVSLVILCMQIDAGRLD